MAADDPRARVRQLLLSGDNTLKNRTGPKSEARARERFERARRLAVESGLEGGLVEIIDRRLQGLGRLQGPRDTAPGPTARTGDEAPRSSPKEVEQ